MDFAIEQRLVDLEMNNEQSHDGIHSNLAAHTPQRTSKISADQVVGQGVKATVVAQALLKNMHIQTDFANKNYSDGLRGHD